MGARVHPAARGWRVAALRGRGARADCSCRRERGRVVATLFQRPPAGRCVTRLRRVRYEGGPRPALARAVCDGVKTLEMIVRCDALLFDLDGVLVDSAACVEETWRQWAESHGLDPIAVMAEAHGRRSIDTIRRIAPNLDAEQEAADLAAREATTTEGVYEVAGARHLLERLPPRRWAIVTSGVRAVASLRIAHTRLPVPAVLVCADEISRGKPDPEGYLTAALRLGVEPADCIVVEDAPAGLEAARAAGMRSIGIAGAYPPEALHAATVRVSTLEGLEVMSAADARSIELRLPPT